MIWGKQEMTDRSRIERRDHLLTELGLVVAPIRELVFSDDDHRRRIPYVRAQFRNDYALFIQELYQFGREGTYAFEAECNTAKRVVWRFDELLNLLGTPETRLEARRTFEKVLRDSQQSLRAIPADDPDTILPAASPFGTYVRLRAICATAESRVQLFDPYLDATVFHRYLTNAAEIAEVTVVTSEKTMIVATTDLRAVARRDRIVAVSELFALERPRTYRFLATALQHDRHLRADDAIYHLGGSIKDASVNAPYTISSLDPTQSNHGFLDSIITGATEWYGPSVSTHRRA